MSAAERLHDPRERRDAGEEPFMRIESRLGGWLFFGIFAIVSMGLGEESLTRQEGGRVVVTDPRGIPLAGDPLGQFAPRLSIGTDRTALVWIDAQCDTSSFVETAQCRTSRVAGKLLDTATLAASSEPRLFAEVGSAPAVTFGATQALIVWHETVCGVVDCSIHGVQARRIDAADALPDDAAILLSPTGEFAQGSAGDGLFLVVWTEMESGEGDIRAMRIGADATLLDPEGIDVSRFAWEEKDPAVAWNGEVFLVVWTDFRNGDGDIYAARVSPSGEVLDPEGIAVSKVKRTQRTPAVVWGGSAFLVVWNDLRQSSENPDIYATWITAEGENLDPQGIPIATGPYEERTPRVAMGEREAFIVWQDGRNPGDWDIYGTRIDTDGTPLDLGGIPIAAGPYDEMNPDVSWTGSTFLTVWEDDRCFEPDFDLDGDGVRNSEDNCIDHPNADQSDRDEDGLGDVCDCEPDLPANPANCPQNQIYTFCTDVYGARLGRGTDEDLDFVADEVDNCPGIANRTQSDFDGDGVGALCDCDDTDPEVNDSCTSSCCAILPLRLQGRPFHLTILLLASSVLGTWMRYRFRALGREGSPMGHAGPSRGEG
ncbi:MAG: hypothetical protein D6812_06645 [Deltaproteobacteria bacterium]|nr:MAG: hypothetical protein D6812_06645 [Deltaproteobacteria bacterium]